MGEIDNYAERVDGEREIGEEEGGSRGSRNRDFDISSLIECLRTK